MLDDCLLISKIQHGDLESLGELYDRYRGMVFRTALAITGDHEAASDLLQDVFLRLYRFINRVDLQRPLEPWLYRMTVNLAYTWVKRHNRWFRPLEELADWLVGSSKDCPQEAVERKDDWDRVQQAVSNLPMPQRVVVVLYYLNDLSLQEIVEVLDVPMGTVKSRLHYGRQSLRQKLDIDHLVEVEQLSDLNL
jgi:RNA polymerase sigma-70 factor (ECF subfamily)